MTAPARPLAVLVGRGAGCHECGVVGVGTVRVGRHKADHCDQHRDVVERVMRAQLAAR